MPTEITLTIKLESRKAINLTMSEARELRTVLSSQLGFDAKEAWDTYVPDSLNDETPGKLPPGEVKRLVPKPQPK